MMVSTIRKILAFAGKEKTNIWKSTALNFLYAIFNMLQVAAVYFMARQPQTDSASCSRPMQDISWSRISVLP